MPTLDNPRHEAFARARARGAYLEDAYEDAGFAPGHGHASRLAKTPEIAERIAELKALDADIEDARDRAVIAALIRVAKAGEDLGTAAGMKETRLTLLEVDRLRRAMEHKRGCERFESLQDI
jgi:hypothetical protein